MSNKLLLPTVLESNPHSKIKITAINWESHHAVKFKFSRANKFFAFVEFGYITHLGFKPIYKVGHVGETRYDAYTNLIKFLKLPSTIKEVEARYVQFGEYYNRLSN